MHDYLHRHADPMSDQGPQDDTPNRDAVDKRGNIRRKPKDWKHTRWWNSAWACSSRGSDGILLPRASQLTIPEYDGSKDKYLRYRLAVLDLRTQCNARDWKYVAPLLITKFTGSLKEMDFDSVKYLGETGVEDLLDHLKERLEVPDLRT